MANGYKVRIGEPTKSKDGKRLMPFVMIFREEQAQESIHDLKPYMSDSSISRQAAIDAIDEIESEVADGDGFQYEKWRQFFCDLPSAELQPTCNKIATSCNQLATDYIRREYAIEVIEKMMEVYWDRKVVLARAWEQIKDLPPVDIDLSDYSDRLWRKAYEQGKADAEPRKKGKWVNDGKGFYKCTSCDEAWSHWWAVMVPLDRMHKELRFCPKCGADMEKGETDAETDLCGCTDDRTVNDV